jgi:hypothetical protein
MPEARLVILGIEYPHMRETKSSALAAAKSILENRGKSPRLYRNSLVFLAPDKTKLQDLDEAVRRYLAWDSIVAEAEELDLTPFQLRQARTQLETADKIVNVRLPETFQWLIVPVQETPQNEVDWQISRLTGQDALAVRAAKKLKNDALLLVQFAPTLLRLELDRIPLWRRSEAGQNNHVSIKQLAEDFARYIYLPRLRNASVLVDAIREGLGLLTWTKDSFAYAEDYDEESDRYRGLRIGQRVPIAGDSPLGFLVKPEAALRQHKIDKAAIDKAIEAGEVVPSVKVIDTEGQPVTITTEAFRDIAPEYSGPKRFHGSVTLDPTRLGRDAGRIADEIVAHLVGIVGSDVTVTLEIEADITPGTPENIVRVVTENCRTLKFSDSGFEKE